VIKASGIDDTYFSYGEDVDLGVPLRLAGHRALHVPDAIVAYVGSGLTVRLCPRS
jgi:GT2 family glycosyltransferase